MGNMYQLSKKQWNPFVGCKYECVYCTPSFQRALKRQSCALCQSYLPHWHHERLDQRLPPTRYMQFIFACSSGDVAHAQISKLITLFDRMRRMTKHIFLMQSKNPRIFNDMRLKKGPNLILGTTIETNRDGFNRAPYDYAKISRAPRPRSRYRWMQELKHPLKMVTIEPVLDFDLDVLIDWIRTLNPVVVWLGYDSKGCHLPEPSLAKVRLLHWALAKRGIPVLLKTIRKAWWEKP